MPVTRRQKGRTVRFGRLGGDPQSGQGLARAAGKALIREFARPHRADSQLESHAADAGRMA